jgi:hypothetical protein
MTSHEEKDSKPKTPLDILAKIKSEEIVEKKLTKKPIVIKPLAQTEDLDSDLAADEEAQEISRILDTKAEKKTRPKANKKLAIRPKPLVVEKLVEEPVEIEKPKTQRKIKPAEIKKVESPKAKAKPKPAAKKTLGAKPGPLPPSGRTETLEIRPFTIEPESIDVRHPVEDSEETAAKKLAAQDILDMEASELLSATGKKRDAHNLLRELKIITAIMLGKNKNKELSQVLDTDKSFTSKQIKELEDRGLVKREGEGRDTSYEVDKFNVMKFLQSKVVVRWKTKEKSDTEEKSGGEDGSNRE